MVKLIHRTDKAEKLLVYMARVSSPNQDNPDKEKLIKYLIDNRHWSPFEMISLCVEIRTSRAISQQILRHRSFHFQEFSQRYQEATEFDFYEARKQDTKNRQNSIELIENNPEDDELEYWFLGAQEEVVNKARELYQKALNKGISKETARFLLPLSTQTKLYMNGTVRDWIHYINLRTEKSTQKEHREIAERCKEIFIQEFPIVAKSLGWAV
jgi:thymidylate synthase (FAD)